MKIRNINEKFGDPITFGSVTEMVQCIEACGYEIPEGGLIEGRDYETVPDKRFRIVANGSDMGVYYAYDEAEAILRYVGEAGYRSVEEAAKVCGQSVEAFRKDITVSEVE